jgi:hypothetical protein
MPEDDPFNRATTPLEQLKHEYAGARPAQGIPSSFRDGAGKVHLRGANVPIVAPDGDEVRIFSDPRAQVCGNCKYFDLESGRREMVRQKFAEQLVREYEWKLHHLGAPVDAIALCGASNGELAITFMSKACDQFRPGGR